MNDKPNKKTPMVVSGTLYTDDENTTGIRITDPAWSMWIEDATVFYFQCPDGSFTARKERRRQGYIWYASQRRNGKLRKLYIGPRMVDGKFRLTPAKLEEIAQKFLSSK